MRFRRHVSSEPGWVPAVPPRRLLRDLGILAGIFVVGFVVASAWLSPVPLITADHAVPRVLELSVAEAQHTLVGLGFRVKLDPEQAHANLPRGSVVWQDPPPGVILPQNSVVLLTPSAGQLQIRVPDLVGLIAPQAQKVLVAAGLKLGKIDSVAADPEPGIVVATRPSAGVGRDAGAAVDLVVSGRRAVSMAGPPQTPAPTASGDQR